MRKKQNKTLILITILIITTLIITSCTQDENNDVTKEIIEQDDRAQKIKIYYFWGLGCPRCDAQEPFMDYIEQKYDEIKIIRLEIHENEENRELFEKLSYAYGERPSGAPVTFIGEKYPFVGFGSEDTTGKLIEKRIQQCIENECKNPLDVVKEQEAEN